MKNTEHNDEPEHITTGDILEDLGFSAEETLEAKIKADIWRALMDDIEERNLKQAYLVRALEAHQPDVSNLLKGKIGRMSIKRLIQYAGRLNLEAEVRMSSRPDASPSSEAAGWNGRKSRPKRLAPASSQTVG